MSDGLEQPKSELKQAAQQALEALRLSIPNPRPQGWKEHNDAIYSLRVALDEKQNWDEIESLRASLREHMAEIHRLRVAGQQALEALERIVFWSEELQESVIKFDKGIMHWRGCVGEANSILPTLRAALEPVTDSHDTSAALLLAQECEAASPIPGGLYSEAAQMLRKQCEEIERMKGVCE